MVSTYYKSNNVRENAYSLMRKQQEIMNNEQQDALDLKNMESLEEMAQAKKYSKLIKNTMGELVSSTPSLKPYAELVKTAAPLVKEANKNLEYLVETKQLSEFVKKINELDISELSKIQRLIVQDLNDPSIKKVINEEMAKLILEGKDNKEIANELSSLIIGVNPPQKYKTALQTLVQKALAKPSAEMRNAMNNKRKVMAQIKVEPDSSL